MNIWDIFDTDFSSVPSGNSGTWVNIQANTGGNIANGGTVRTGDANASVMIRTNESASSSTASVNIETEVNGVASSSRFTSPSGIPITVDVQVEGASTSDHQEAVASTTTRITVSDAAYTDTIQTDTVRLTIKERMYASIARMTQYVEQIFTWFWN
ncbi:MAG: hypothetical protein AAB343_02685 [Patescibacteria group bacterium]